MLVTPYDLCIRKNVLISGRSAPSLPVTFILALMCEAAFFTCWLMYFSSDVPLNSSHQRHLITPSLSEMYRGCSSTPSSLTAFSKIAHRSFGADWGCFRAAGLGRFTAGGDLASSSQSRFTLSSTTIVRNSISSSSMKDFSAACGWSDSTN